jgi:coenzyme F420-reducing hydrogenase beta subunit
VLNRIIDRLTKRSWSATEIEAMLGPVQSTYLGYASDPNLRAAAASGGVTSALLIAALNRGDIDGAVVCRTFIEDGKVRAHFVLARTRQEIQAAGGSKYVETKFLREVLPLIEQNKGRFAICGLPCDISNLKRLEKRNFEIAGKVALRIALLCGHNSRKELVDGVVDKLRKQEGGCRLMSYRFRGGHWRGELEAAFEDGRTIRKPFSYFSDYRNLYFFAERKCLACIDHFGYDADISMGDVWLYALRDDAIKQTGVLIRTERAARMFATALACGDIIAQEVRRETILDGQQRIAPTHYNVAARSRAGKLLRVKIPHDQTMKVSSVQFISALIGMLNMRWSEGPWADAIFAIPRPLLRGYLFLKKGLESIK